MFYHADAGDRSALMRADTDTTGAVLRVTSIVDDDAKNFHVRPSPDGTRIAFDSDREGERAVYVADADGQQRPARYPARVTPLYRAGRRMAARWHSSGREPGRPKVWNLWTVDLESGETRRLTNHRVGQPWGAAWFPDGRRIAYSHEDRLIVRSLDGGDEQIFNTPRKGRLVRTPAVSPDGRKVMFQVRHDGAWLLDVASGGMRKVLTDPTAEEFTWSPDGRQVAYHSRNAGGWGRLGDGRPVGLFRVAKGQTADVNCWLFMSRQLVVCLGFAAVLAAGCRTPEPKVRRAAVDVVLPAEVETITARVPRHATLDSLLRQHELAVDLVACRGEVGRRRFQPARSARRPSLPARPLDRRRAARVRVPDRRRQLPPDLQPRPQAARASCTAAVVPIEKETEVAAVRAEIDGRTNSLIGALDARRRKNPAGACARGGLQRQHRLQQRPAARRRLRGGVREIHARG